MEENFEYYNDEETAAVNRYSDMLKNKNQSYFDIFELEHIIDFYIEKYDLKNASEVIDYALKLHPGSSTIIIKKAQVLINNGHPYKSLKLLKDIGKIEKSNHMVYFLKGVVYSSLGEISKGIANFENALLLSFENKEDLLINIASTLQHIGQYEFTAKYYKQCYDLNNENSVSIYELAYCYEKLNYDNESIEFYKKYLSIDPFSKMGWFNLACVYHKIEEYENAIDALEYVLAIDPGYNHAIYQKALNEVYIEKFDKGIETFKEYLKLEADNASALFHIGETYAKQSKYSEALYYFDKSLKVDNLNADAFYGQAFVQYSEKKYTDAYYSIKRAIKIDKEDPDFWHLFALINQALGFITESEKAFKTSIDLENSDPQIWIDYSKLNYSNNNLFKKINILSQAYEHFSDNAEINYRLAANLALIENNDSAAYHLKMALTAEPEKLEIFWSIYSLKNSYFDELIEKFSSRNYHPDNSE
jgi:tetratricopeptide (TPR) repeat protein